MDSVPLTEVPQNLQMLVRLIVRGFYSIEDVLIVDMLVRNLCMSEDDICELLKFDRKMLRSRINTLKADKLLQARTKNVTTDDGKTQKEQYYFINYKSFVNVVKYKLDHIRKKLEMEERDQTSRASFKCMHCQKTYTDLEADQLLDMRTGNLHCIICRQEVQEDMSSMPRHDTRILLTNFNEQMESLFSLLRDVENIKLAAEFSEPKPQDFSSMRNSGQDNTNRKGNNEGDGISWSGESSKNSGFQVDSSIDVNINTENGGEETVQVKEKPIWLTEATSFMASELTDSSKNDLDVIPITSTSATPENSMGAQDDDVLKLLRQHENKRKRDPNSESDDSNDAVKRIVTEAPTMPSFNALGSSNKIEEITISDDESDDEKEPLVSVGNEKIPLSAVDNDVISKMSQEEKNHYISLYQDYYRGMDY